MSVIDVIKYEGDNRTFVHKHPAEDFNTSTQLIVHESQRAIFFYNGQALDMFGPAATRWKPKISLCSPPFPQRSCQAGRRHFTPRYISST